MKVLWFSVVAPEILPSSSGFNGGGWISSLQKIISKEDIKLGIAFESDHVKQFVDKNTSYFPINAYNTKIKKIKKALNYKYEQEYLLPECLNIIDEYEPDLIHIFGSESSFGLIPKHTSIPSIIHMQGSLPAYHNAHFPPGMSLSSLLMSPNLSLKDKFWSFKFYKVTKGRAKREEDILRNCKNFMGRTHWDKSITRFYNPNCKYFHVEEALRDSFNEISKYWEYKKGNKLILTTTISGPLYKGVDMILKSARLLKNNTSINFEWRVFGVNDITFFEKHYSINSKNVNVMACGIVDEVELRNKLLESHFYIHPSYIDNSPNSLCEAQLLGVPIICTNVGGVSSLVDDGVSGFLVPANDPLKLAHLILKYSNDEEKLQRISTAEIKKASARHDKFSISKQIMHAYNEVLG